MKYQFQIVVNEHEFASYISVYGEDMDEARREAEIKARRICKKEGWTYTDIAFIMVE